MNKSTRPPGDAPEADRDEFFIGWGPTPKKDARFLRPIVVARLLVTGGVAATVASRQRDPGTGPWDGDNERTFDGIVSARPYAMIHIPGDKPGGQPRTMLLVEDGKFGALPWVEGLVVGKAEGGAVRVAGTVLHRDERSILELVEGDRGMLWLKAARSSSTRSASCPRTPRPSGSASCRSESLTTSAAPPRSRWTCASWPPPTVTCSGPGARRRSARASTAG